MPTDRPETSEEEQRELEELGREVFRRDAEKANSSTEECEDKPSVDKENHGRTV